ncbi:MAG: redoxin domain-containing protein [Gemmatimonadetes bacterium]|nr:redoxin domain-containing protein [Gemmatimonadota bacterium]
MLKLLGLIAALGLAWPAAAAGQASGPLEVGVEAPDFELVGASRAGVLPEAVRLSDFRGKTVVLAFFYRVRTPG